MRPNDSTAGGRRQRGKEAKKKADGLACQACVAPAALGFCAHALNLCLALGVLRLYVLRAGVTALQLWRTGLAKKVQERSFAALRMKEVWQHSG